MRKDIIHGKLSNPFIMNDGSEVKSLEDWEIRRREIIDSAVELEFGGMPPKPESVRVEPLDLHGKCYTNTYRIHCGTKEYPFSFCIMIWRPDVEGKCPAIVTGDMLYDTNCNDAVIAEARRRGFAVVKFNRVELAPDLRNAGRECCIFPMWPDLKFSTISAWAWGYQRVVDALLQLDYIDPTQIAVTGHSRGGKTVLLAGATDERITYINPNDSGAHGCGCYRYEQHEEPGRFKDEGCEKLEYLFDHVPDWMGEGMREYIGRENEIPHDSHTIKALIAPRYLLETNGYTDTWGNPRGSYLSNLAAREVWKLYGCPERCQCWYRNGGHAHGWEDFNAFFDFIEAVRNEAPLPESIAREPYNDMEPIHDWKCPEIK